MNLHVLTPKLLAKREDPKEVARRFWGWWSSEIWQVLPPRLQQVFNRQDRRLIVCADGNTLTARLAPAPEAPGPDTTDPEVLWPEADIAVVELSPLQAIRRRVTLPLGTEDRLADVLGYEMDRLTPFAKDDVYFEFRVVARDVKRQVVNIDLIVALKKTVDGILDQLDELGIEPSTVLLRGSDMNLLPQEKQAQAATQRGLAPVALTILAALLATLALAYPLANKWLQLQELDAEISSLSQAAVAAQETRDEIAAATRQGGFFADRRARTPTKIRLLDEITRVLPDDTWLSQVQIKGDTIRIQGESEGASSLIGLLEASDLLRDARFSSPVTKNPRTSNDRFVIQAFIETGEAAE